MDFKQILIFGLFLVPVLTSPCYEEDELQRAVDRRMRHQFQQPLYSSSKESPAFCPVELYNNRSQDPKDRSISPWRYVIRTLPDHFPSTYSEAECLCLGCILIEDGPEADKRPVMSDAYNSVPVLQTKMFLNKRQCSDKNKYHLEPVYMKVAVGCTCVRPKPT
ncbi:interleukin-17C [Notolabrus celidotus]|uniref:interleukin-17C n=1 Tax=Notolabrus celidotus TaxID=1203425 RepID=UPI00148F9A07|nr:interleukin-17C [Notolabrus celidotus]